MRYLDGLAARAPSAGVLRLRRLAPAAGGGGGDFLFEETWPGANGDPWPDEWEDTDAPAGEEIQGSRGQLPGDGSAYLTWPAAKAVNLVLSDFDMRGDLIPTSVWAPPDAPRKYTDAYVGYRMSSIEGYPAAWNALSLYAQSDDGAFVAYWYKQGTYGNYTEIALPGLSPNQRLRYRILVVGLSHKIKIWPYDDPEPAPWLFQGTDTTSAPGVFGLGSNASASQVALFGPITIEAL